MMQFKYLIMLFGFLMASAGFFLLYKGKSIRSASEFKILGISIRLQSTSLALIVTGAIIFLVPYLISSRGIAKLEIKALPFKVSAGDSVWIVWHAENLDEVFLINHRKEKRKVNFSGEEKVYLEEDGVFTLEGLKAENTVRAKATVAVVTPPKPIIKEFAFDPSSVEKATPVILYWKTQNTDKAFLTYPDGHEEKVCGNDYLKLKPQKDTTYTLGLENGETMSASVKVTMPLVGQLMGEKSPKIHYFKASSQTTLANKSVELSWRVSHADLVEISGLGRLPLEGNRTVHPQQSTNYVLKAENDIAKRSDVVRVEVTAESTPHISLMVRPSVGKPGEVVTLEWEVKNAIKVVLSPDIGEVPLKGSRKLVLPKASLVYQLTATGENKLSVTKEAIVSIIPEWLDESSSNLLKQQLTTF